MGPVGAWPDPARDNGRMTDSQGAGGGASEPASLVLLGSTGSIGTQTIDVVAANPDRLRVVALAAGGGRPELLAGQAIRLGVEQIAVARAGAVQDVQLALYAQAKRQGYEAGRYKLPKITAGPDAIAELAAYPCDVVLNAVTGSVGLAATLSALRAGRRLALANKESLIVGGPLVKALAADGQLVPVDSEHSAIAQCLRGGTAAEVRKLIVTASGGPFRGRTRDQLTAVTPQQALAHPTWDMGPVITINSATLVNKGLEVIEAHLLFDVPFEAIEVVVHPQSMVHSMVEFTDGSTLAQASPPDMRLPIALALGWPDRIPAAAAAVDWTTASSWEFEPLDAAAFPAVELAREVGTRGGTAPAVYNAANEVCVAAFTAGELPFLGIVDTIAEVVAAHADRTADRDLTLDGVLAADAWARRRAAELLRARAH